MIQAAWEFNALNLSTPEVGAEQWGYRERNYVVQKAVRYKKVYKQTKLLVNNQLLYQTEEHFFQSQGKMTISQRWMLRTF